MLAQTNFIKLVRFGCGAAGGDSVLARLHLGEAEGEICDDGEVLAFARDVFVPAEGAVDAESLAVEYAFEPVGFADVSEWTVLNFTVVNYGHE